MKEAIKFHRTSRDWISYPILRFSEVPEVEVHLIGRPEEKPLGAVEASMGPPWTSCSRSASYPGTYPFCLIHPRNRKGSDRGESRHEIKKLSPEMFRMRAGDPFVDHILVKSPDPSDANGRDFAFFG
jgi:hypothetical protein